MKNVALIPVSFLLSAALALGISQSVYAAKQTAPDAAQINKLITAAKTKADHVKLAHLLESEAAYEDAKAKALAAQAEAYKEHKHGFYDKNIGDLVEHTSALAQHYADAAKLHKSLAEIHAAIASELK
ncbi:hypothetical protein [Methyloterricola oryzae]|uniref:hypothetical protein n=1 Tax=Methyloterricola oryzae TaxID=1495050 RepID=UPI0005EBDBAA|nr:hypothetical protein [Methyloterricola oryzae]